MFFFPSIVCWNGKSQGSQLCGLFDKSEKRPCIGTCGHSACRQCLLAEPSLRCPVCHVAGAFSEGVINYQALNLIEVYSRNCVAVYEQWWRESQETIGDGCCLHCNSDYQTLCICVTCELEAPNSWTKPILRREPGDPEDPPEYFLDITVVSAARLQKALQCVNCSMDDPMHDGHKTMKLRDVRDVEKTIKLTSYMIAGKVFENNLSFELEKGANKEKHQSCRLRYLRIKRTAENLILKANAYFALLRNPPLLQDGFEQIHKGKQEVEAFLDSLKVQWDNMPRSAEKCKCTELRENNMGGRNLESLYNAMTCLELTRNEEGVTCPMDFSWNEKFHSSLKYITGGPKTTQLPPVIVKTEIKKEVISSRAPEFVPFSEYRLLYDHVVELTNVVEKMKKAMENVATVLEEDNLELSGMDVPKLPKLPY